MGLKDTQLGNGVSFVVPHVVAHIYGGPFRKYVQGSRRLVGVKMAEEINHPHEISIPTEDFSVPDIADLQQGMKDAINEMSLGNDIYVGCMGGIGRTGLFMACMMKVAMVANPNYYKGGQPVNYVRANYHAHAVETVEQQAFVAKFDTAPLLQHLQLIAQQRTELVYVDKQLGFFGHIKAAFKSLF